MAGYGRLKRLQEITSELTLLLTMQGSFKNLFLKNGPNPAPFCLFSFFSHYNDKYSPNLTINEIKS